MRRVTTCGRCTGHPLVDDQTAMHDVFLVNDFRIYTVRKRCLAYWVVTVALARSKSKLYSPEADNNRPA